MKLKLWLRGQKKQHKLGHAHKALSRILRVCNWPLIKLFFFFFFKCPSFKTLPTNCINRGGIVTTGKLLWS